MRRPVKHLPVVFKVHNPLDLAALAETEMERLYLEPSSDNRDGLASLIPKSKPTPVVLFPRDTNRKARRARK